MTVIAFDGTTLASDGLSVSAYRHVFNDAPKFRVLRRGVIAATCGTEMWGRRFEKWALTRRGRYPLVKPSTDDEPTGTAALYVDGKWYRYFSDADVPEIMGLKWALGSGGSFAMSALVLRHDAIEACWAAMQLDTHCGASIWSAPLTELVRSGNDAIRRNDAPAQTWPSAQGRNSGTERPFARNALASR